MHHPQSLEPWLRGTLTDVPAIQRGVLHALELAREDTHRWCAGLTDEEVDARPCGLPSVGFHLRHIIGSLDRLLSYAESRELTAEQLQVLQLEAKPGDTVHSLLQRFDAAIRISSDRVRQFRPQDFEQPRAVGRAKLPTTVGGLLVHIADHTQRHLGQLITTAKLIKDKNCLGGPSSTL